MANQTLGGTALARVVEERATYESAAIHVVVPAIDPAIEQPPAAGTASENAERRLGQALDRLKAAGVNATGEVGASDPMEAIANALKAQHQSGIIISTLPAGLSRWLRADLPHRVAREFHLSVEWIEARSDSADEPTVSKIHMPRTTESSRDF